jgi:dihydroorotase
MAQLRIRNGRVVTPSGVVEADLVISGEKIAGLVDRDHPTQEMEEIDASGKTILPGGIDLHAHTRTPGLSYKEDFHTASMAAAAGGITTFVDMPNVEPPTVTLEDFEEKRTMANRDSIVDWGHFVSGSRPENVEALAEAGVTGFKIFMIGGGYPHDDRIAVNQHDRLYQSMEAIARTGLPLMVHPFDQALFDMFSERAWAAGKPRNHVTFSEVYTENDIVWRAAVAVLLELQKETGVRLQVLHTHAAGSIRLIRQAKAAGLGVTAAIDPKYFHLRLEDLERLGPKACPGGFVTQDEDRMRTIWEALNDGTIDVIDSDHAPHTVEDVEQARINAWGAHLGSPQYDHELMILLTDVNAGRLRLESLARALSENPARILGIYPQKGALLPGSDADLVIVDLNREKVLSNEGVYTKCGWSPYEGWNVKGVPVLTMLRGTVIARDGDVIGERGFGRYVTGQPQEWTDPVPGRSPGLALRPKAAMAVRA